MNKIFVAGFLFLFGLVAMGAGTIVNVPGVPSGTIIAYGGTTCPTGWLLAEGSSQSRTGKAKLYAAIGTAFGTVDGNSFNVPDLRGRFLRGHDGGVGRDTDRTTRAACDTGGATGDNVGSCEGDIQQGHTHRVTIKYNSSTLGGSSGWPAYASNGTVDFDQSSVPTDTHVTYGAPRIGNENRPVNVAVKFCIKE